MKQYLTAAEVASLMGVSVSLAYKIIQKLNKDLESQGYITISGRCPAKYLQEKCYGLATAGEVKAN